MEEPPLPRPAVSGPEGPQQQGGYTIPGVLHFIKHEFSRFEKERANWEVEKAELLVRAFGSPSYPPPSPLSLSPPSFFFSSPSFYLSFSPSLCATNVILKWGVRGAWQCYATLCLAEVSKHWGNSIDKRTTELLCSSQLVHVHKIWQHEGCSQAMWPHPRFSHLPTHDWPTCVCMYTQPLVGVGCLLAHMCCTVIQCVCVVPGVLVAVLACAVYVRNVSHPL